MTAAKADEAQSFGDAVRARLAELGKSQEWLGEQFGVTQPAVAAWLKRTPAPARVFEIEDVLGIPGQLAPLCGFLRPGYGGSDPRALVPAVNRWAELAHELDVALEQLRAHEGRPVDELRDLVEIAGRVAEMRVLIDARAETLDRGGISPEVADRLRGLTDEIFEEIKKVAGDD